MHIDGKGRRLVTRADPTRLSKLTLERSARSHVSTIYLPQAYPMMPLEVALKASLDPHRLVNCVIKFSTKLAANGDILDYCVEPTLIRNFHRMDYYTADAILSRGLKDEMKMRSALNVKMQSA